MRTLAGKIAKLEEAIKVNSVSGAVIQVQPGETRQQALDRAPPGTTYILLSHIGAGDQSEIEQLRQRLKDSGWSDERIKAAEEGG